MTGSGALEETMQDNMTPDAHDWPARSDGPDISDQRQEDRRKAPSEGFAYVSMVGWIDRREQTRRKDDPYPF